MRGENFVPCCDLNLPKAWRFGDHQQAAGQLRTRCDGHSTIRPGIGNNRRDLIRLTYGEPVSFRSCGSAQKEGRSSCHRTCLANPMGNLRSIAHLAAIAGGDIDLPRRYFADGGGHRVIVGLTPDETSEFEALDRRRGVPAAIAADGAASGIARWQELYVKHAMAWEAWMIASRGNRADSRQPAI